jgi:hypothetical protein
MSNDEPLTERDQDAETARDVLSVFNAEEAIEEPGRPRDLDPGESLPADADVPPPQ